MQTQMGTLVKLKQGDIIYAALRSYLKHFMKNADRKLSPNFSSIVTAWFLTIDEMKMNLVVSSFTDRR